MFHVCTANFCKNTYVYVCVVGLVLKKKAQQKVVVLTFCGL